MRAAIVSSIVLSLGFVNFCKADSSLTAGTTKFRPLTGIKGMVVCDDRVAAEWGAEILRGGGNAVDAAVGTAFALSVTRPFFASLGGGGFLVYCPAPAPKERQKCAALDFREQAPERSSRDMYIKGGKADTNLSQNGAAASGVPGVTAGLLSLLEKYGSKPRADLMRRPISLAKDGIVWTGLSEKSSARRWAAMNAEAKSIFGCAMRPCRPGTQVKQPDLAKVLESISKEGRAGFYGGRVAQQLVAGLQAAGGIITVDDLKSYEPRWREPIEGDYRGMKIVSMPPPSSGGIVLIQMLGFAERADRQQAFSGGPGSASTLHALAHAMSLAFADRAKYLGDPDFVQVPGKKLTEPSYLDARWSSFDPAKANLSPDAGGTPEESAEPRHTTHLSVIDRNGNAVSMTVTINDFWGSGFVPPGTGVVMNDQMDDFSIQPGVANMFGLIGAEANAIAPRKRPLSSMTPTIVQDAAGRNRIVLGAEGGPKIPTAVFLTLINRLKFEMALPDSAAAPRIHQQSRPKTLKLEPFALSGDTKKKLEEMGYETEELSDFAIIHALEALPNGEIAGVADIRGEGAAVPE